MDKLLISFVLIAAVVILYFVIQRGWITDKATVTLVNVIQIVGGFVALILFVFQVTASNSVTNIPYEPVATQIVAQETLIIRAESSPTQLPTQSPTQTPTSTSSATPEPTSTLVPTPTDTPKLPPTPVIIRATVRFAANIFEGPDSVYQWIGKAEIGERVQVIGIDPSGDWLLIKYKSLIGWTMRRFVVVENEAAVDIVTDIPPTPIPPTVTPTPVPPTVTLTPTITPTPLPTSTPTNTPLPTPTINIGLQVGQWYTENDLSFMVKTTELSIEPFFRPISDQPRIALQLVLRNTSNTQRAMAISDLNFTLKDNLGNTYLPGDQFATAHGTTQLIIGPHELVQLEPRMSDKNGWWTYWGNYLNPGVTELYFEVFGLSSIEYAQWVIPISH